MVLLAAAIGVVVGIQQAMPDSDHSAIVDGRHRARSPATLHDVARQERLELRTPPRLRRQENSTIANIPQSPTTPETSITTTLVPGSTVDVNTVTSTAIPSLSTTPKSHTSAPLTPTPDAAATVNTPAATTSTTKSKKSKAKPSLAFTESYPNGPEIPPTPSSRTTTRSSISLNLTSTHDVGQPSSAFPGMEPTAINTRPDPTTDDTRTTNGIIWANTVGPPMKTESEIISGTTTEITITSTIGFSPLTTTNSVGDTIVSSPPPKTVVTTEKGVVGGLTVPVVRPDDGLTAETRMLTTTSADGRLVTVVIVSTPGRPTTMTVESVIGGTRVTTTLPPETFVSDLGNGVLTTITRTLAPSVFTTGGVTTAMVLTTTPGRVVTTAVATTISGTPTLLQTVMTITPTPSVPDRVITASMVKTINGTPTTIATVMTIPMTVITADVETTINGKPTTIKTVMTTPVRVITTSVTTTINGTPTTVPTTITLAPAPTNRPSGDGRSDESGVRVLPGFTSAQYFAATYLPTILAACLAVPFGIISSDVRRMQPFHALATRHGGAPGLDSLTLDFGGIQSVVAPFVQAWRGEPVPLIASLGAWLSALLAPLAAEAIGFKIHGSCIHLNIAGCGVTPGVSPAPTNALVALLAAMLVLLITTAFLLRRWETGVHADPWTLVAAASMSHSEALRECFQGDELPSASGLRERIQEGRFQLALFDAAAGADGERNEGTEPCYEYGVVPVTLPAIITENAVRPRKKPSRKRHVPFIALTYTSRIIFLAVLIGLIALLGYYFQLREATPFELFMDSQGFGVKFLFALLGTVIALFWHAFFEGLAAVGPFARMSRRPRRPEQSVLLSPCTTNVISGAVVAVQQRHSMLLAAALMAGIADIFLPALLANVPFALTQTYTGWVASTSASLAALAVMAVILIASLLFSRWPHMPVDPRTIAGAIFYFARSEKIRHDLCGRRVALMDENTRKEEVKALSRLYVYEVHGEAEGVGRMRVEVEGNDDGWERYWDG